MVGPHITPSKDKTITQAWRMGGGCESGREVEVHASNTGKVLLHEHEDIASTRKKFTALTYTFPAFSLTSSFYLS